MLIVLHNQCLIIACLMRGLPIQPETMLISEKNGFFKAKFLEFVSRHTDQSNVAQETSSGITGVCESGDDLFFFVWRSPLE